jgi:hypothetical protein
MKLFCRHLRVTFPQTAYGDKTAHVTCLDCGDEFDYDWQTMEIGQRREPIQKGETHVCDPPDTQN